MGVPGIVIALGLPAALGMLMIGLIVPAGATCRRAVVVGYGLIAGLVVVPLLMRALHFVGLPVSFLYTGPVVAMALLLLLAYRMIRAGRPRADGPGLTPTPLVANAGGLLFWSLLALLALRVLVLGTELWLRPLYPFDATMHWATKARVWYESGQIVPFVESGQWLKQAGQGVFTDHHPDYPITIPLLQLWMSSAIGQWNESLMNLPWLLCFVGLGFAFYGQARQAGTGPVTALVFTYLLLSMPLINTHVALAGYADVFMGACYGLAIMAFYNWTLGRQVWQGMLAVLAALSCLLIKNEGFYWLLTFLPACVVALLSGKQALAVFATAVALLAAVLLLIPQDFAVAGHSLERLNLYYRPGALTGIRDSLFVHGNWHLLAYLFIALAVVAVVKAGRRLSDYAGIITALACALALFLVLFLFTIYATGAIRFTAVGRISIHLVPAFVFLCLLLYREISGEARRISE